MRGIEPRRRMLADERDLQIAAVVRFQPFQKFAADPLPLMIGMHEHVVNIGGHLAVVHGGNEPHEATGVPCGKHRIVAADRPLQAVGDFP